MPIDGAEARACVERALAAGYSWEEIEQYLYETPPERLREGRSEARREARRVDEVPTDPRVKPREPLSLSTVSPFYAPPVQAPNGTAGRPAWVGRRARGLSGLRLR